MTQTITDAPVDAQICELMLQLTSARGAGKSICPSEVARALARASARASAYPPAPDAPSWRALMPQVRAVAYRLAAQQQLHITQRGRLVDPLAAPAVGAIRLTVWQTGTNAPRSTMPVDATEPRP